MFRTTLFFLTSHYQADNFTPGSRSQCPLAAVFTHETVPAPDCVAAVIIPSLCTPSAMLPNGKLWGIHLILPCSL